MSSVRFPAGFSRVGFFGSRSLPSAPAPGGLVSQVVASFPGAALAVGCCVGADAAVLRAVGRLGPASSSSGVPLSVFAAFGPGGAGSWRGSAVALVSALAASPAWSASPGHGLFRPAEVRWWAGGGPAVPLRRRLAARSAALVSFVAASSRPLLVGFVAGPPPASRGSWAVVRRGLAAGVPVLLFSGASFPVSSVSLPPLAFSAVLPGPGVWSRAVALLPAGCWFPV